jgi:hypothetical protein
MAIQVDPIQTIPDKNSTGAQWIQWHQALKDRYGKKQANSLFLYGWEKRRASGNILTGNIANTQTLREYLEKQGITVSGDGVLDYAADALDNFEDYFGGIFGVGKTVAIVIALLILIPIAFLLINIARNPKLIVDGLSAYSGGGAIR